MESSRKRWSLAAKRLSLFLTSVAVACGLCELLLRVMGIGYGTVHMESSQILHHVHPLDYRFVSYHPSREYGGHVVYYDEDGRRASPRGRRDSGTERFSVAFLGDSFVEAPQVSHDDSFVGRLESVARGRASVRNYGTSSYSPILYLIQWGHQVQRANPTHVFLMLFGNDVRNDLEMAESGRLDADGEIVGVSGLETSWLTRVSRMAYLGRLIRKTQLQLEWAWLHREDERVRPTTGFVEENPDVSPLTDRYLKRLAAEIDQSGATLAIMACLQRNGRYGRTIDLVAPSFTTRSGSGPTRTLLRSSTSRLPSMPPPPPVSSCSSSVTFISQPMDTAWWPTKSPLRTRVCSGATANDHGLTAHSGPVIAAVAGCSRCGVVALTNPIDRRDDEHVQRGRREKPAHDHDRQRCLYLASGFSKSKGDRHERQAG